MTKLKLTEYIAQSAINQFLQIELDEIQRCLESTLAFAEKLKRIAVDFDKLQYDLLDGLCRRFLPTIDRPLACVMHVMSRQGRLEGATGETRFKHFCQQLRSESYRSEVYQHFPLLEARCKSIIRNWFGFADSVLERLDDDWPDICEKIFQSDDVKPFLTGFAGDLGDLHNGHQSVLIAHFTEEKLVYKPRSGHNDLAFRDVLEWYATRGGTALKVPRLIDRDSHLWQEYISHKEVAQREDIGLFFGRMGELTGILSSLFASDIHFENIIASGHHPVLIDFEVHSTPILNNLTQRKRASSDAPGDTSIRIQKTGLLNVSKVQGNVGHFFSGALWNDPEVVPKVRVKVWSNAGTDRMKEVFEEVPMRQERRNLPTFLGQCYSVMDSIQEYLAGWEKAYGIFHQHKADVLAENEPFARLFRTRSRILLRNTSTYSKLLMELNHPRLLASEAESLSFLKFLEKDCRGFPELRKVVPYEISSILQGDVPIFYHEPQSLVIQSGEGGSYEGLVGQCGRDRVLENFRSKSSLEDLARQRNYLKMQLHGTQDRIRRRSVHADLMICPHEALNRLQSVLREIRILSGLWMQSFIPLVITPGDGKPVRPDLSYASGYSGLVLGLCLIQQAVPFCSESELLVIFQEYESMLSQHLYKLEDMSVEKGLAGVLYALQNIHRIYPNPEFEAYRNHCADRLAQAYPELMRSWNVCDCQRLLRIFAELEGQTNLPSLTFNLLKDELPRQRSILQQTAQQNWTGSRAADRQTASDFTVTEDYFSFHLINGHVGLALMYLYRAGRLSAMTPLLMENVLNSVPGGY